VEQRWVDERPTLSELDAVAARSQLVLCISGDARLSEFELRDISDGPPLPVARAEMETAGRLFVGLVALSDGRPQTAILQPIEPDVASRLGTSCVAHIAARLNDSLLKLGLVPIPAASEVQ
jgi:hypothetical protein